MKTRIEWIDFAKGLTILLVAVGHTISNGLIRGSIFSFHMPLFFILSLATYKLSPDSSTLILKIRKASRHLLVPALFIWLFQSVALYRGTPFLSYVISQFKSLIWSSGVVIGTGSKMIPPIGIPWFLIVLFLARGLYDGLHLIFKSTTIFIAIILSFLGVVLGVTRYWLYFSGDIALAILPFLYFGNNFLKIDFLKKSYSRLFMYGFVWAFTLVLEYGLGYKYLELAIRRYPLFPLSYLTAIAGVVALCQLSVLVEVKFKHLCYYRFFDFFVKLGRNSLIILVIHALEDQALRFIWELTTNQWINLVIRLTIDIFFFYVYLFLKNTIKNKKIST